MRNISVLLVTSLLACDAAQKPGPPADTSGPADSDTDEHDTADSSPTDLDGDGYDDAEDCDDTRADVNPAATEPTCINGVDDDCDGDIDEASTGMYCLEDAASTWIQELGDHHTDGVALSTSGDLDGDGRSDLLLGGPSGYSPELAGHIHIFLAATLREGIVSTSEADWTLVGEAGTEAGQSLNTLSGAGATFLPDVDEDGRADVLVGARLAEDGAGAAYVVLASWLERVAGEQSLPGQAWTRIYDPTGATAGLAAVASGGDMDGDGTREIVLGGQDVVWVLPGSSLQDWETDANDGTRIDFPPDESSRLFEANLTSAGDTDGDGLADMMVACLRCGADSLGQVFLFLAPSMTSGASVVTAESADIVMTSDGPRRFGLGLSAGADLDGDGLDDWAAGSYENGESGGIFVFRAGSTPAVATQADAPLHFTDNPDDLYGFFGDALAFIEGGSAGPSLAAMDSDDAEGSGYGSTLYVYGNDILRASGTYGPESADTLYQPRDAGQFAGGFSGGALRADGDMNGDGRPELVLADPYWGPYGEPRYYGTALVLPLD